MISYEFAKSLPTVTVTRDGHTERADVIAVIDSHDNRWFPRVRYADGTEIACAPSDLSPIAETTPVNDGYVTGQAAALAAAQSLRDALMSLNATDGSANEKEAIRKLAYQYTGSAYQLTHDALKATLTAILSGNVSRAERVLDIVYDSGESVAYALDYEANEFAENSVPRCDYCSDKATRIDPSAELILCDACASDTTGTVVLTLWTLAKYGMSERATHTDYRPL